MFSIAPKIYYLFAIPPLDSMKFTNTFNFAFPVLNITDKTVLKGGSASFLSLQIFCNLEARSGLTLELVSAANYSP